MRKIRLTAVLTGCLILAGCHSPNGAADNRPAGPQNEAACQEDEACWNCQTMGNRICGPMINVVEAEQEAQEALRKASTDGGVWSCWAEVNSEMPKNYEVLCERL